MGWGAFVSDKRKRAEQQAREIEANQQALRDSIEETQRLVHESEDMLRRHRREREEDDAAQ
jgi:hypothetical protein